MLRDSTILNVSSNTDARTSDNSTSDEPYFYLEVCRGRTQFPRRPVFSEQCLIGCGQECDLRLGGDDMPLLHSQIVSDDDGLWLEAIASAPTLQVNGSSENYVALCDGDRIDIGPFSFLVHVPVRTASHAHEEFWDIQDDHDPLNLDAMSAADLVAYIECEQESVDRYEGRRELGAKALLQMAGNRVPTVHKHKSQPVRLHESFNATHPEPQSLPLNASTGDSSTADPSDQLLDSSLLTNFEHVIHELDSFSRVLESRTQRLSQQEVNYAETVAVLLDVQHKLTIQLETVLTQFLELQHKSQAPTKNTRAIA